MADLGEAVLTLRTDNSQLNQGLDQAKGKAEGVGDGMSTAAKAGTAALAALGTATVAAVTASVSEFAGFERGMNEVFTLIPGASKAAMSAMSGDVKSFAADFGVLPKEVVPALYSALSAGVPPGNVFEFMETAQKAAVGGVSDLATTVDGLSSVVNAYGSDVITAGEASDLMFTAVRLGKTTFDELSSSLFQVNPVASALGIEFGEVTAALAAMTAQGVPTSVATTQLRQAFVELSTEGSKTDKVFREIAGMGFREFIASGGTVQEALQLLEQHAASTGVGINDLFGSVEAGGAALALTGGGTAAFTSALDEMALSAGATDAAFQQMDQGVGRSIDKLKAQFSVLKLEIGEALAPAISRVADAFTGVVSFITGTVIPAFQSLPSSFQTVIVVGAALAGAFALVLAALIPLVSMVVPAVVAMGGLGAAATAVGGAIATVAAPALIVIGVLAALAAGAYLVYKNWDTISEVFGRAARAIGEAIPEIGQAFDVVRDAAGNFADYTRESFDQFLGHITNTVRGVRASMDEIGTIFLGVGNVILGGMEVAVAGVMFLVDTIISSGKGIGQALSGDIVGAYNTLKDGAGNAIDEMTARVESGTQRQLQGFEMMATGIKGVWNEINTDHRNLMEQLGVNYNALESNVNDYAQSHARAMMDASGSTGDLIVSVVEMARQYGQSEEQIASMTAAISRQETSQDKANIAYAYALGILHNYDEAARAAAGGLNEMDRAAGIAAVRGEEMSNSFAQGAEKVEQLFGTLGDIQSAFQIDINNAGAAVQEWQGHLQGAEQAIGLLDAKREASGGLSQREQEQYDTLTAAVGRYAGGVHDSTGALVDAEIAKYNFITAQDELNAAVLRGEQNLDPYKMAVMDAAAELDPATAAAIGLTQAQEGLAGILDTVVGDIRELMEALGLIPPEARSEVHVDGIPDAVGGVAGAGDELANFNGSSATASVNVLTADAETAIDTAVGSLESILPWYSTDIQADNSDAIAKASDAAAAVQIEDPAQISITADGSNALTAANTVGETVQIPDPPTIALTADGGDVLSEADIVTGAIAIPDPSTIIFTGDASDVTTKAATATGAIAGVPKNPPATIMEAVDNISSVAYNAAAALNSLPSSFTVTINADAAGFYATVAGVDSYIPRSPAKKGPFSRTPDWNFMWRGLPETFATHWRRTQQATGDAADEFKMIGRDHSGAYARGIEDGTGSVVDAAVDMTGAANTAVVKELGGGRNFQAEMFLAELDQFSEFLLNMVIESATSFESDLLDSAKSYSDAVNSTVTMISNAFDLLNKLGNANPSAASAAAAVTELKMFTEHIAVSVGDSALAVGGGGEGGMLEQAQAYATAAQAGVDLIMAGVELFASLQDLEGDLDRAKDAASNIKFLTEHIVLSVGDSAAFVNSSRGEGFTAAAESYATAAQRALDLMAQGVTVMGLLSSLEGDLDSALANASQVKFLTEHIVLSIGDSAAFVAGSRGEGFIEFAALYAEAALASMQLMEQGVTTFGTLQTLEGDLDVAKANASQIKFLTEHIVQSLGDSANLFSAEGLAHLVLFVDAALRGQELMHGAGATLAAMMDFGNIDTGGVDLAGRADAMVALIETVARAVEQVAVHWETSGLTAVENFSSAAQAGMETIGQAGAALEAILLFATIDTTDRDLAEMSNAMVQLIELISRNIEAVAVHWESEGLAAVEAFSTSAAQGLEVMKVAGEALSAILMYGEMSPEERDNLKTLAWEFTGVMDYLISMIQDVSKNYSSDALSALSQFAEDATTSLGLVKAAADSFKAMVDHSRVTQEHADAFVASWEIMVWAMQEIAQIISNQGVQEAVRILNANQEIFALLTEAYALWQQNEQMASDMGIEVPAVGKGSAPGTGSATGGAPITQTALPATGATTSPITPWIPEEYRNKMADGGVTTKPTIIETSEFGQKEGVIPLEGGGADIVARAMVDRMANMNAFQHAIFDDTALSRFTIPDRSTETGGVAVNFLGSTTIIARDEDEARQRGGELGWQVRQKLRAQGRS